MTLPAKPLPSCEGLLLKNSRGMYSPYNPAAHTAKNRELFFDTGGIPQSLGVNTPRDFPLLIRNHL